MPKRIMSGTVVSSFDKTVVVRVSREFAHPKYGKRVSTHKKYPAHCLDSSIKIGDKVEITDCRPISKTKRWSVISDSQI